MTVSSLLGKYPGNGIFSGVEVHNFLTFKWDVVTQQQCTANPVRALF